MKSATPAMWIWSRIQVMTTRMSAMSIWLLFLLACRWRSPTINPICWTIAKKHMRLSTTRRAFLLPKANTKPPLRNWTKLKVWSSYQWHFLLIFIFSIWSQVFGRWWCQRRRGRNRIGHYSISDCFLPAKTWQGRPFLEDVQSDSSAKVSFFFNGYLNSFEFNSHALIKTGWSGAYFGFLQQRRRDSQRSKLVRLQEEDQDCYEWECRI